MRIQVQAKDLVELVTMLEWIKDNGMVVPDYYHNGVATDIGNICFCFTNDRDAMLFALRWA